MKTAKYTAARDRRRSGVALIIVVGVLALLMLMAGTLALMSRMSYRMGVTHRYSQSGRLVGAAVESYVIEILYHDKFGADGILYNNDPGNATWGDWDEAYDGAHEPWIAGSAHPSPWFPRTAYTAAGWASGDYGLWIDGNDNGVRDAADWMVPWRAFDFMARAAGGEYGDLTGLNVRARISPYIEDIGGARVDLNNFGSPGDSQCQGLTPYEAALREVGFAGAPLGGAAANALANQRYGPGGYPGTSGDDNNHITRVVDQDLSGDIGMAEYYVNDPNKPVWAPDMVNELTEFNSLFPIGDDLPYSPLDLYEFWMPPANPTSRAWSILGPDGYGLTTDVADMKRFTINHHVTPAAPAPLDYSTGNVLLDFDNYPGFLGSLKYFRDGRAVRTPVPRELGRTLKNMSPRELADFIEYLQPQIVVRDADLAVGSVQYRTLIRQMATNLIDMVDREEDDLPTVWTDDTGRTYYGVEQVPYIAEMDFAVPCDTEGFDFLSPLAGPGKFIKLVNPWNYQCSVENLKIRLPFEYDVSDDTTDNPLPRLRRWASVEYTDPGTGWDYVSFVSYPYLADLEVQLDAGEIIAPRGYYYIVDDTATLEYIMNGSTPTVGSYTVWPDLRYAQEAAGYPHPDPDEETDDEKFRLLPFEDTPLAAGARILAVTDLGGGLGNAHAMADVIAVDDTNDVALVLLLPVNGNPIEEIAGNDLIFSRSDVGSPPWGNAWGHYDPVTTLRGPGVPVFDWFEAAPDTSIASVAYPAWIQAWLAGSPPADLANYVNNPLPTATTVAEVLLADSPIQFSQYYEDTAVDTEDDWYTLDAAADSTVQALEVRPCWYYFADPDPTAANEPGEGVFWRDGILDGAWGEGQWTKELKDTTRVASDSTLWSNSLWEPAIANDYVLCGDQYYKLGEDGDLFTSFPSVDPWRDVQDYDETQQNILMDVGGMVTPAHIGMLHTGIPWTTVSLGDYLVGGAGGTPLRDRVRLHNFINYIAAPAEPYTVRPWERSFRLHAKMATAAGPTQTAVGDLDLDGRLDVIVTCPGNDSVQVFYGLAGGGFVRTAPVVLPGGDVNPGKVVVADLNNDLWPDCALVVIDGQEVMAFYNNGGSRDISSWTTSARPLNYDPYGLVAADINGDGNQDLLVSVAEAGTGNNGVRVLLGNGTQTLQAPGPIYQTGEEYPLAITAGDFNGDGVLDVAAVHWVNNTSPAELGVILGNGDGTFGLPATQDMSLPTAFPEWTAIETADLNGDGYLDLVMACGAGQIVYTFFGEGDGTFDTPREYPLTGDSLDIAVADFNGDNKPDVAFSLDTGKMGVLFNKGDGFFEVISPLPPISGDPRLWGEFPTDGAPTGLTAADMDGDGAMDVVLAVAGRNAVGVMKNLGDSPRIPGRINVNTAPVEVLRAIFREEHVAAGDMLAGTRDDLADAIELERSSSPFTSLDDFFDRMAPELFLGQGPNLDAFNGRSEAAARFICNMIDVRSDLYGVRVRVQLYRDSNSNNQHDANEEIMSDRTMHLIIDRSQQPPRVLLKRNVFNK